MSPAHTSGPLFFVSDAWSAPATSPAVLWTLTRGWVGAPNERAPFRFHDAVVGFFDRYLSRTQNLAVRINVSLSVSQADLWPQRPAAIVFFVIFVEFCIFFVKIRGHSERCRNIAVGIVEINTF